MKLEATKSEVAFAERLTQLFFENGNVKDALIAIENEPIPAAVGTDIGKVLKWTAIGAAMQIDPDAREAVQELVETVAEIGMKVALEKAAQRAGSGQAPKVIIALASRRPS